MPRLFAPSSVWNARVPKNAHLDSTSQPRMAAFWKEIQSEEAEGIGPWIQTASYSTPIYTVRAHQRRVPVTLDDWGPALKRVLAKGVPIPAHAKPAKGTDAQMTIYQPATDSLWEFWRARREPDGWHASWGGAMQHVSRSPGYYTRRAWPGLAPKEGWRWGSTASSLPIVGGTITMADLESGHIDHALALNIPSACKGRFAWPAQRTDGNSTLGTCLPEGAHLRIDPSLNLSKLHLAPIALVIAKAAQRYGMVVRDVTHHAVSFLAEDPTPTGTWPYRSPTGFFGGHKPWFFLRGRFPWNHLQLLPMRWCTEAPCSPSAQGSDRNHRPASERHRRIERGKRHGGRKRSLTRVQRTRHGSRS